MKAEDFIKELEKHRSDVECKKLLRYFKTGKADNVPGYSNGLLINTGVRMHF